MYVRRAQYCLQPTHLTSHRYYTASLILGTVALAYGSVPLYKMVRLACHEPELTVEADGSTFIDLSTNRLERSTGSHPPERRW